MQCLARRIVDGAMLHLLKMWLVTPVEEIDERGNHHRTTRNKDEGRGTPQGAPISPLLANLYMRRFVLGSFPPTACERVNLLREPDAGDPHVRFDERDVETEHGRAIEAPPDERGGNR